jgi:hypothetical protein
MRKSVSKLIPVRQPSMGAGRCILSVVILCSSRLRPPVSLGPDRIIRLASEAGFEGLAVDAGCPLALLTVTATESLRAGLPVGLVGCPLPESDLGKGKRLPHLAALDDPEERLAAVRLARRTLELGGDLSVRLFTLDLGPVPLHTSQDELRLRFARREMEHDEPGGRLLRRALEERKARAGRVFDACRLALEPLLETAGRLGATLTLPLAATPWQLPSPREAQLLLREFSGAPLALVLAPARLAILRALGVGGPAERLEELAGKARVFRATDQVGLDGELLLGLGELADREVAWPASSADTAVVAGSLDATFKEVLRARRKVETLRAVPVTACQPAR